MSMRPTYYGVFFKDTLIPATIASSAALSKAAAMEEHGYDSWSDMRKTSYRLGKLTITEVLPVPIGDRRKRGA